MKRQYLRELAKLIYVKWNNSCHVSKEECHSHQRFQASKCEFLSLEVSPHPLPRENSACDAVAVKCPLLPHSEHQEAGGRSDARNQETGYWSQIAEMHVMEMISLSPDTCIFLYVEEY